MKRLYYYPISEKEFANTEYRPLDVERHYIDTEDDWNYGDIIDNAGDPDYTYEKMAETTDGLIVWAVTNIDAKDTRYIVEDTGYEEA